MNENEMANGKSVIEAAIAPAPETAATGTITVVPLPGMEVRMDVTPRWLAAGESFYEDYTDIVRALNAWARKANLCVIGMGFDVDVTGQPHVWVTHRLLAAQAGDLSTTTYAYDQANYKKFVDGLDASNARRMAVTEARLAALKAATDASATPAASA
jgi:hypothetical protein